MLALNLLAFQYCKDKCYSNYKIYFNQKSTKFDVLPLIRMFRFYFEETIGLFYIIENRTPTLFEIIGSHFEIKKEMIKTLNIFVF